MTTTPNTMQLPEIPVETETITLPVTQASVDIRPFKGSEEKELLLAIQSKNEKKSVRTLINVIQKCVVSGCDDVRGLPPGDFEYLFIHVYKISVNDVIELGVICQNPDCKCTTEISIPIEEISIETSSVEHQAQSEIIEVKGLKIEMKEATIAMLEGRDLSNPSHVFEIAADAFVSITDETGKKFENMSKPVVVAWLDNRSSKDLKKIFKIFKDIPSIEYSRTLTCPSCDEIFELKLMGLADFFPHA